MTSAVPPVTRPAVVLPPAPGFDWSRLLSAWVPDDPFRPDDAVEQYYAVKAAIAHWLQPETVLEIGVRAGYSALAFHMGHPFGSYVGLDADRGDWGGVRGYLHHAGESFRRTGFASTMLHTVDSQRVKALGPWLPWPTWPIDLVHVDGDHGWAGAKHDIVLALDAGARYVVVDDAWFVPAVRAAAEDVIAERHLQCAYVPDGMRGNYVIPNEGVSLPDV